MPGFVENLTGDESIHGFAKTLVSAADLGGAGAAVAAESDLVIDGTFK